MPLYGHEITVFKALKNKSPAREDFIDVQRFENFRCLMKNRAANTQRPEGARRFFEPRSYGGHKGARRKKAKVNNKKLL